MMLTKAHMEGAEQEPQEAQGAEARAGQGVSALRLAPGRGPWSLRPVRRAGLEGGPK